MGGSIPLLFSESLYKILSLSLRSESISLIALKLAKLNNKEIKMINKIINLLILIGFKRLNVAPLRLNLLYLLLFNISFCFFLQLFFCFFFKLFFWFFFRFFDCGFKFFFCSNRKNWFFESFKFWDTFRFI